MMKKIAFVSDVIFPYCKSGRSRRLYELTTRLAKKHEVHIYTMKWWDGPNEKIEDNVHLHAICKLKPLWIGARRSIWQAIYFSYHLFFPLLFSDYDFIDSDQYPHFPCYVAKIVSILKRKPLVITWHEVWGKYWNEYMGISGYFGRMLEWFTSKLTKHNIVNSEATKHRLEAISKKHTKLITPGTALQYGNLNRKGVLFVGRIDKEKNLDVFIKVAKILKNMKFTIIGYGPDEERIKKLAKLHGVNVKFLGDVDDKVLFNELKKNKIFLSPSTREGFSIAVLEAMGSGMPTIVVNHKNNAAVHFVPDELIVDLNEEAIANKIQEVDTHFLRLSREVKHIAQHYTWERAVSSYENYLHYVSK